MGVGRDMIWARYTNDAGGFHSVKLNKANFDLAGSGFSAFNAADPYMPAGYMRRVVGYDPATGDSQDVYVGTAAAALWTAVSFAYPRLGDALDITFTATKKHAESMPKPRGVINI